MNLPLNIDLQQVLLHLLNFTILFAILYFLLYKPVKSFMEKRQAEYKAMEEKAHQALSDAEAQKKEYADKLSAIDDEIRLKKQQARKEINDAAEHEAAQAKREAERIIAAAKTEAESQRNRIMTDAKKQLSDMVLEAADKIVQKNTSDAYDSFLDSVKGRDET